MKTRIADWATGRPWLAPVAIYAVVVVLAAVAVGRATGRWVPLPPLDEYTARLPAVPLTIGPWVGHDVPLEDADGLERAGIAGHLHRQYRDARSGETVTVLLVCGRPGPISVHTPDVCYRGAGYGPIGEPVQEAVSDVPLWVLRLHPPGAAARSGMEMEVRWTWVAPGAGFAAPTSPRVEFAREPALYKLYVITGKYAVDGAVRTANVAEFLRLFGPPIRQALAAPPAGTS